MNSDEINENDEFIKVDENCRSHDNFMNFIKNVRSKVNWIKLEIIILF